MKIGAVLALIAGLALAVFLVLHTGIAEVLAAVTRVGLGGFAIICLSGLAVAACLGSAWYALLSATGVRFYVPILARQLRDSFSDLLPFTQLGGMVIGARAATLGGVKPATAYASMMVDITTELLGQIAFIILGLMLGFAQLQASAELAPYADAMIIGTGLLIPGAAVFIVLQRRGSHFAEKLAAKLLPAAVSHTESFSQVLHDLYRQPKRLALSATLHLLSWLVSGLWIWLIFRLLGVEISVFSALTIEALLGALRAATVFIPASIGVQEAGYATLAPVFCPGIGPEIGLAVSLLKRGRDIAVGVPMLLLWQMVEGRRAFAKGPNGAVQIPENEPK